MVIRHFALAPAGPARPQGTGPIFFFFLKKKFLDYVRRKQRHPQGSADTRRVDAPWLGPGSSKRRLCITLSSSIFRHRNARASALTMALSTRGRGAHSASSGVTTSFRPPRFWNVSGISDGDRLTVGRDRRPHYAAACALPATSRTSPARSFDRSRTSKPFIRTSTRSTSSCSIRACSAGKNSPHSGSSCVAAPLALIPP